MIHVFQECNPLRRTVVHIFLMAILWKYMEIYENISSVEISSFLSRIVIHEGCLQFLTIFTNSTVCTNVVFCANSSRPQSWSIIRFYNLQAFIYKFCKYGNAHSFFHSSRFILRTINFAQHIT